MKTENEITVVLINEEGNELHVLLSYPEAVNKLAFSASLGNSYETG
jgi:hypothetical protein